MYLRGIRNSKRYPVLALLHVNPTIRLDAPDLDRDIHGVKNLSEQGRSALDRMDTKSKAKSRKPTAAHCSLMVLDFCRMLVFRPVSNIEGSSTRSSSSSSLREDFISVCSRDPRPIDEASPLDMHRPQRQSQGASKIAACRQPAQLTTS